jgi:hypothetical protein
MESPNEIPPEDPVNAGEPVAPASLARWWLRIALFTFAAVLGGWAMREVPADWRAGRPLRAIVEALLVGAVFYAWLRLLWQIWRGQRAVAEERALAEQREQARIAELAARARQRE